MLINCNKLTILQGITEGRSGIIVGVNVMI